MPRQMQKAAQGRLFYMGTRPTVAAITVQAWQQLWRLQRQRRRQQRQHQLERLGQQRHQRLEQQLRRWLRERLRERLRRERQVQLPRVLVQQQVLVPQRGLLLFCRMRSKQRRPTGWRSRGSFS
jgi:hypothetical protein